MGILWKYKTQSPVAIPEQDRTGLNRVDGAPLFGREHLGGFGGAGRGGGADRSVFATHFHLHLNAVTYIFKSLRYN